VFESGLDFDQAIVEQSGTSDWMHLGMLRPYHEARARRQALRFDNGKYTQWMEAA